MSHNSTATTTTHSPHYLQITAANERPQSPPCCWACSPNYPGMIVCSDCGNKRCPRASDHRLACSGSNEPGQPGSIYSIRWTP